MLQPMMKKNKQQNIVIVGGGMVGVSLALLLSKKLLAKETNHYSVTLIEKFAFPETPKQSMFQPSFDDRSTAISAGSAAILKQLDCWPLLHDYAEPIQTVHVSDRGHFGGTCLDANNYGVDAVGYVIENRWLGQVLLQQLQSTPVKCLAPATVKECLPKKHGYQLTIESNSKTDEIALMADLLIIADGADSALRQSLGIDTTITHYGQSALIANVSLEKPHNNIAYERFTDEGPIALLPLHQLRNGESKCINRASLVWTLPDKMSTCLLDVGEPELLEKLHNRFGYRAGKITGIGKKAIYPLQLIQAREQVRSHLVIVGNAAHFLHPVAGQGFNLALRDCQMLTECLQLAQAQEQPLGNYSVLKHYLEKQEFDQQLTIGLTDSLVKTFSSSKLPQAVLRQLGLMSLNTLPVAKNRFAEQMMGMTI